jgi:uncharacterized protein (TIGR00251 family)
LTAAEPALPYTVDDTGVRLAVRLTPRARHNELAGLVDVGAGRTALAVRLAAPPVDGAANRALTEFLASTLGVPKSAVGIVAGEKSRLKTVLVRGGDTETMRLLLESLAVQRKISRSG